MFKINKIIICISLTYLSSCSIDGTTSSFYNYGPYNSGNSQMLYPDSYDSQSYQYQNGYTTNQTTPPPPTERVEIPDSYHVGYGHPTSAKDMDKSWVKNQNSNAYTIELANDSKPAKVAGILHKAPKNERAAEIKTNSGNYIGLYGSYPSYEAAKQKLESLPEEVKQNASIKEWSNVQSQTDD